MHPNRRRKKRPNYGIRTVEVLRGPNGFGFTISGQQPCILSCIVANSPADQAGLRAGDFLISVNGISVSKITHDAVVNLIGNCVGPIRMTIAENYYSDSSDEEMDVGRMVNARKPKYMHKPRSHRLYKEVHRYQAPEKTTKTPKNDHKPNNYNEEPVSNPLNISNPIPMDDEAGPIEYKALVGYLGTIEMPKQLLPNSRLQTVCSCIRKLRQEKRTPTAVLMTILPTCLTLKNSSNHILAIYPTNRVVYIGSTADKDSRYFGLVTSAGEKWEYKFNNAETEMEISNSCHVFMTDPKLIEHSIHSKKAESFKFNCTPDVVNGNCLEFPRNALYIVNLVQNMYKLQESNHREDLAPLIANSPQPSASSNSDSGIGFRDDCGNISDRILVVEFPAHRSIPVVAPNNRPVGIDGEIDLPLNNELNNIRCKNNLGVKNDLSRDSDVKQMNNLNNIRACESGGGSAVNIKNIIEKDYYLIKQNNDNYNRLTCRAMPDRVVKTRTLSPSSVSSDDNNTRTPVLENDAQNFDDRPKSPKKYESDDMDFKSSMDNISMHSSKSYETNNHNNNNNNNNNKKSLFKAPLTHIFKRPCKMVNSCENLDIINYKLSPKVYGLSKPIHSCEELNNLDASEKYGYGSLQELCSSWNGQSKSRRNVAQSEPDVRIQRNGDLSENGCSKISEGPASWATAFEKLLDDPFGLHTFAEFLKKEFSAENIYFWTACERYRRLPAGAVERLTEAQRIYQQHLCVGAPEPVNVDSHARQCAEQALQDAPESLFDQAQKQIFNLMKFDSYPRFLKSNLYKQCLAGDLEKPQLDAGLLLQPPVSSKLKKSLSNAEDRRRKSLLPWHRKNRSKSKDRGESEYNLRKTNEVSSENVEKVTNGKNEIHSSRSSLTSLDLAISQETKSNSQDESTRSPLCRVILSNGSTTVVQIKQSETIQELVKRLLDKRGLNYSSFEVYTDKHSKALNVCEASTKLASCEVTVEQRVVFKLDLPNPNRKVISVKSKYTKIIIDVLRPILYKYNYNIDQVKVTIGDRLVDLYQQVTEIDGARLNIQFCNDYKSNPLIKIHNVEVNKLEEITNQVFEGILQGKADSAGLKTKSDRGSVKSEDWGSEHSSGIFGRFLRRDSNLADRKKKSLATKCKLNPSASSSEDMTNNNNNNNNSNEQNQLKKPLIAKWKAGVNKFQVTCSESDELVEGLTRAQRRLEDQRGTEINFELPDFLKDKENENLRKPLRRSGGGGENDTRFYIGEQTAAVSAKSLKLDLHSNNNNNYENRTIINNNLGQNQQSKLNNLRIYSPQTKYLSSDESFKSNQSTPTKSLENTVIEKKCIGSGDPPPLPPKPKIVPIKPPNWGQNGLYKTKLTEASERTKTLYLEQPSSSFV